MFRSPVIDGLVVLVILLLIVGPKKLPQLGRGLGDGMREFKEGITGENKHEKPQQSLSQAQTMPSAEHPQPAQPAPATGHESRPERSA
ncbi:MAG TPA: twin-arginine translocase TatA/TatE family subunit [Solirubrobacteraceae bacterium]|nr:twin-arginine translocase TatA/TatE family subunit [Solirubrobacteraceae bacterium]